MTLAPKLKINSPEKLDESAQHFQQATGQSGGVIVARDVTLVGLHSMLEQVVVDGFAIRVDNRAPTGQVRFYTYQDYIAHLDTLEPHLTQQRDFIPPNDINFDELPLHPRDAAERAANAVPDGWMTLAELTWLARQASDKQRVLEIGTFAGRSTYAMALTCPGTILTIDTWLGEYGTPELNGRKLESRAHWNLGAFIGEGRVQVGTMSSAALWMEYRHGRHSPFDFIQIDGGHDYYSVLFDVHVARRMLAPGGVISGHDWHLVRDAVLTELPEAAQCAHTLWEWRSE